MGSVPVDNRPCSSSYRRSDILAKAPGCVTALWEPAPHASPLPFRPVPSASDIDSCTAAWPLPVTRSSCQPWIWALQPRGGEPQADRSIENHPLMIGGRTIDHGFRTHADSRLVLDLKGSARRFTA